MKYWKALDMGPGAVAVAKAALKTKLWRGTPEERLEKLRALNRNMSAHFEVPECSVAVRETGIGPHYVPGDDSIVLDVPSLVSWAHEFGHHLLHCKRKRQNEDFPRAFSLGLFYRAAPRMFEKARAEGRLKFTNVNAKRQAL
jgi:hypothetical protein